MSTNRITRKDVERQVELLQPLMLRAGLIPEGALLVFENGSRTNGLAYRLFYREPPSYGLATIAGFDDYLGWSAKEALDKLYAVRMILAEGSYRGWFK